jgi:hypothetical protein
MSSLPTTAHSSKVGGSGQDTSGKGGENMEHDTLIDRIEHEMLTDDEDREKESAYLEAAYQDASDEAKQAIDNCFIALCGWELQTMIDRQKDKSKGRAASE